MSEKIFPDTNRIRRHSGLELFEHWAIAISGLILLLTGIFELPIAKRYYITDLPGMAWSGDFITSLKIHYLASIVFVGVVLFHVVYHLLRKEKGMLPVRGDMLESVKVIGTFFGHGEEPPFDKYLPEQRVAYIGMAVIIGGLIVSGLIKTYKNIFNPQIDPTILGIATWSHNIFFVLFFLAFIAHILAIILKPNRPMVRSIFTGKVRLDYARKRHPLWLERIEGEPMQDETDDKGPEATEISEDNI